MIEKEKDIVWSVNVMITLDVTIAKEKDVIVDHVVRKFVNDHEAEVENAKNANEDDQSKRIK